MKMRTSSTNWQPSFFSFLTIASDVAQFPGDKFEFLKRTFESFEICENGIHVIPGRELRGKVRQGQDSTCAMWWWNSGTLQCCTFTSWWSISLSLTGGDWWAVPSICLSWATSSDNWQVEWTAPLEDSFTWWSDSLATWRRPWGN